MRSGNGKWMDEVSVPSAVRAHREDAKWLEPGTLARVSACVDARVTPAWDGRARAGDRYVHIEVDPTKPL